MGKVWGEHRRRNICFCFCVFVGACVGVGGLLSHSRARARAHDPARRGVAGVATPAGSASLAAAAADNCIL